MGAFYDRSLVVLLNFHLSGINYFKTKNIKVSSKITIKTKTKHVRER